MKITGKVPCEHCGKDTTAALNLDKFEPKVTTHEIKSPTIEIESSGSQKTVQEVKEITKEITTPPSWIPGYKCKGKDCGQRHKNKKFKRPKGKCTNCDQHSPNSSGDCPQCQERDGLEEITDEDLDGINFPKSEESEEDHEIV